MTKWVGTKARRLVIAGSVAFFVGVPLVACMGGADTSTDGAVKEEPKGEPKKEAKGIADAMISTWAVVPGEDTLRQLKIINAAIEGNPPPKKLGDLSADEKKLYNDAKKASGSEQQYFRGLISMMKGARVTFKADGSGQYDFDGGTNPFKYTTSNVNDSSLNVQINYDHGTVEKADLSMKGSDIAVHFTSPNVSDFTFKKK